MPLQLPGEFLISMSNGVNSNKQFLKTMKKSLLILLLLLSVFNVNAQPPDGTYKLATVTVQSGTVIDVDSTEEQDPTVSAEVKGITVLDLNHWGEAYTRIYDYPHYSTLVYYINDLWIPQTTDDLTEGFSSLYWTTSRFNTAFSSALTSGAIGTSLGYTPYNSTNPAGYISSEVDGSTTNELQTLSKVGNQLTLSNSGGTLS